MAYEKLQAILEDAGMSHVEPQEVPSGTADGSNKAFTVAHIPLTDSNYDDVIDASDILVLVNGNPADVASVDASFGVITLVNAPPTNAEVLITYRYSPVSLQSVSNLRDEVTDLINQAMRNVDPACPYDSLSPMNPTVRIMTRLWSAALILIRDYGFNQDTELTSKDGFKKLGTILGDKSTGDIGMLARFKAAGGVSGGDMSADTDAGSLEGLAVQSDADSNFGGDVFPKTFDEDKHKFDDRDYGPGFNALG